MKTKKTTGLFALSGMALMALCFIAWKNAGNTTEQPINAYQLRWEQDTTLPNFKVSRSNREYRIGDLDKAMKDLDKAMIDLDKNLKIDFSKMEAELKSAMEDIKNINVEKISRDVEASLKKIDWKDMKKSVEKSLREAEVKWKEVDAKKLEKELSLIKAEVRAADIITKIDMEKIKKEVDLGMASAKTGIEKAKKELVEMKTFIDSLEKDGLIDKKKGFRIEIRNKKLIINGKEQPKEVNDKYSKYLDKEDCSISSDGDSYSSI